MPSAIHRNMWYSALCYIGLWVTWPFASWEIHLTDRGSVINAMSFDIEDWFHLLGPDALPDVRLWLDQPSLVTRYTERILEILGEHGVRATFFVLGWIADRYPQIAGRIASNGHELGTHSYWHRPVHQLTRREFREDLIRSIAVLEQQTGQKVRGFRAPGFSITPEQSWAFDIMLDLGLEYDASLIPFGLRQGMGYPCCQGPHVLHDCPSGRGIAELPASVMQIGPYGLRFSGGGYLRLLPASVIRWCGRKHNSRGMPFVVYLHPRDLATDQPLATVSLKRQFLSCVGLSSTERKLRMLCTEFRFETCVRVLAMHKLSHAAASTEHSEPNSIEPSVSLPAPLAAGLSHQ